MVLEHLHTNLHNFKKKPEIKIVKLWLRQILDALCYCHDTLKIVHCDLKPPNILVNKDGTIIKLADFGLYETIGEKPEYLHICTLWYKPPEQILGTKNCHPCIDMWAVGCIFAELILGGPLFPGDSDIDQLFKIFKLFGTPNSTSSPTLLKLPDWSQNFPRWAQTRDKFVNMFKTHLENDGIDLLLKMLDMEPTRRISAREALQDKWLKVE
jgi:cyclin-dependent kinase 2